MTFLLPRRYNLSSSAITPPCFPAGSRVDGLQHCWKNSLNASPKPWLNHGYFSVITDSICVCACSEVQAWLGVNHLVTQKTLIRYTVKHLHIFHKFAFITFIYLFTFRPDLLCWYRSPYEYIFMFFVLVFSLHWLQDCCIWLIGV